jgi:hypothetical protein
VFLAFYREATSENFIYPKGKGFVGTYEQSVLVNSAMKAIITIN